jgi:hypothetical protein
MQYIKLGDTGLDVSPIAIGAMTYGDPERGHPVWSLDEDRSRPLIKQARYQLLRHRQHVLPRFQRGDPRPCPA